MKQDFTNMHVTAERLQLADIIRLGNGTFMDAIVKRIDERGVHVERPYMSNDDYTHTGGVTVYIGHEDIILPLDSGKTVELVRRCTYPLR